MKKTITLVGALLVFATYSFAVDVEMKSSEYVNNQANIDAFDIYLTNKKGFKANKRQDLEKNLKDDWLLANSYYTKHMTSLDRAEIVNLVNRHLAAKEVVRLQESVEISDDITKSYYLDNLANYKLKPILNLELYTFETLQDAFKFYTYAQENGFKKIDEYIDQNTTIRHESYKAPQNKTLPVLRRAMRDMNSSDYFTPPVFYRNNFLVIYIDSIDQVDGYLDYDLVKANIAQILHNKTYLKKRQELIQQMQEQ